MPSIVSYRKFIDAVISRTLRLPEDATHSPVGTELATLPNGLTYVSLPDGAVLPTAQPEEIAASVQVVTLTAAQAQAIKAVSPHVRLINRRVRDKIAERYEVMDEIKLLRLRTVLTAEYDSYSAYVDAVRQWGQDEKAKLGL